MLEEIMAIVTLCVIGLYFLLKYIVEKWSDE